MSAGDEDRPDDPGAGELVGYKRPPAAHRFRKGQSGNPKGRPRRSREQVVPRGQGLDLYTQPATRIALEEAYRPVTLRDGDKVITIPTIQAIHRSLGLQAMKGNRLAAREYIALLQTIETSDRETRTMAFETAVQYKTSWEREIAHARRHGLVEPSPLPHPDDVLIDLVNGTVVYAGPRTPEEKYAWDSTLEVCSVLHAEIINLAERHGAATDEDNRWHLLELWQRRQAMFDKLNEPLPRRYRIQLKAHARAPAVSNDKYAEDEPG